MSVVPLAAPRRDRGPVIPSGRESRDRLELLTALIDGPGFAPMFRGEVIAIPADHAVFPWHCVVAGCRRPRWAKQDLCAIHSAQWRTVRATGVSKSSFVHTAAPLELGQSLEAIRCRICPDRPAFNHELGLCHRHRNRWRAHLRTHAGGRHGVGRPGDGDTDSAADFDGLFARWLQTERPYLGYGQCRTRVCDELACSPLGLCTLHLDRYRGAGRPGGAKLPVKWFNTYEGCDRPTPVSIDDEPVFERWCQRGAPVMRIGEVSLRGLRPLLAAEIKWGLHTHGGGDQRRVWELPWIQGLIEVCQRRELNSLLELDRAQCPNSYHWMVAKEIVGELKLIYLAPADTREAGFIQTQHRGRLLPSRSGYYPLTSVPQRWLRNLLWDHLTRVLGSPRCPRTATFMDIARKACVELGAFPQVDAPGGGHDPFVPRAEHAERFVADIRRRERLGLPALTLGSRGPGTKAVITQALRQTLFNGVRRVMRQALESGEHEQLGLDRGFITAMPPGGRAVTRARSPFPDEVARALATETNLAQLAAVHDPSDRGLRDMWEAIVCTGRRASEVITPRLECLGRYDGLAMLWHDQTKVGKYDQAIRIPEALHTQLAQRQHVTSAWFADQHGGRHATAAERSQMALFPSGHRNRDGQRSLSYNWFNTGFSAWVAELDLGPVVAHQARHTLATRLLRHGATLSHIRRYLGHVSDRMAEHYAQVSVSEIEDVLAHVWVTGPGATAPGTLIAGSATPMSRPQAQALAIDLARANTPTPGGFCTFQPVVDGGACPWKLDCDNCDKFVLSGADLLYRRRKREQWRSIAERAPDDATADYLHQVFEPTARAIDGLENALAGLGLLDDALALDLRRPQDYFHRLWSIGFPAADLARAATPTNTATAEIGAIDIDRPAEASA
jgi:integrase